MALITKINAVDDNCVDQYKTESACNAVEKCTWCYNTAVPLFCAEIRNAKRFPPEIFRCDKINSTLTDWKKYLFFILYCMK